MTGLSLFNYLFGSNGTGKTTVAIWRILKTRDDILLTYTRLLSAAIGHLAGNKKNSSIWGAHQWYWHKCDEASLEKDIDNKKADFNNGKKLGEKYIDQYPNSASFRFWYLVNLGSWAEEYGIIAAAREGVSDLMRKHSKEIISLDPEYENGGGYFMLGVVHYKSPYIPFILSWPDNDKAISYISKSISIGEPIPNQKVYLAQALYKDGRKVESIKLLEEVANMQPSIDDRVRDWEQIGIAKQLLADFQ